MTNRTFRHRMSMFSVIDVIAASGLAPPKGWHVVLLLALEWVPTFALTPRFILGIRKLYAHDVQRGRGEGIDTGFGLSLPGGGPLEMATGFLNAERNVGLEGVELSRRGEGIDAGFGLPLFGCDAVGTAVGFMDAELNEMMKIMEEIST